MVRKTTSLALRLAWHSPSAHSDIRSRDTNSGVRSHPAHARFLDVLRVRARHNCTARRSKRPRTRDVVDEDAVAGVRRVAVGRDGRRGQAQVRHQELHVVLRQLDCWRRPSRLGSAQVSRTTFFLCRTSITRPYRGSSRGSAPTRRRRRAAAGGRPVSRRPGATASRTPAAALCGQTGVWGAGSEGFSWTALGSLWQKPHLTDRSSRSP